jgi:hypothetical protein
MARLGASRRGCAVAAAAGLLSAGAAPASVATAAAAGAGTGEACGGDQVTVVVDYGPLGGGTQVGCADARPGRTGAEVVAAAGFRITGVAGMAGFVCRVDGKPAREAESCQRTPPGDAYWGLFTAQRAGAPWVYATVGVAALEPAAGSLVGLRFQDGSEQVAPSAGTGGGSGTGDAPAPTGAAAPEDTTTAGRSSGGSSTALVPVAAVTVGGLLVATYLVARRRQAG